MTSICGAEEALPHVNFSTKLRINLTAERPITKLFLVIHVIFLPTPEVNKRLFNEANTSFSFTEIWFLVNFEDDDNLRVLSADEIQHIFPDDEEEEEIQVGDVVSALWPPNGHFYDARVLQQGGRFSFLSLSTNSQIPYDLVNYETINLDVTARL